MGTSYCAEGKRSKEGFLELGGGEQNNNENQQINDLEDCMDRLPQNYIKHNCLVFFLKLSVVFEQEGFKVYFLLNYVCVHMSV